MKIRRGNDAIGAENFDADLSPGVVHFIANFGTRPAPIHAEEIRVVTRRLRVLLGEGLENARRCGEELTATHLAMVCDDLLRETREPGYRPEYGDSVRGFLLGGIFDDLVQQPSNIFDSGTGLDGRQYFVPMSAENWRACLEALRFSLLPAQ